MESNSIVATLRSRGQQIALKVPHCTCPFFGSILPSLRRHSHLSVSPFALYVTTVGIHGSLLFFRRVCCVSRFSARRRPPISDYILSIYPAGRWLDWRRRRASSTFAIMEIFTLLKNNDWIIIKAKSLKLVASLSSYV